MLYVVILYIYTWYCIVLRLLLHISRRIKMSPHHQNIKILAKLRLQTTMQQHCSLHLLTAQRDAHAPPGLENQGWHAIAFHRPHIRSWEHPKIYLLLEKCRTKKGENHGKPNFTTIFKETAVNHKQSWKPMEKPEISLAPNRTSPTLPQPAMPRSNPSGSPRNSWRFMNFPRKSTKMGRWKKDTSELAGKVQVKEIDDVGSLSD